MTEYEANIYGDGNGAQPDEMNDGPTQITCLGSFIMTPMVLAVIEAERIAVAMAEQDAAANAYLDGIDNL